MMSRRKEIQLQALCKIKMYSLNVALRRNFVPKTQTCKVFAGFWRSQKTEAAPLQTQDSAKPELDHDVRPYEEIPQPKKMKFNLESILGFYQAYKMTEGFTKLYKITNMMYGWMGPIYRESFVMGIPSGRMVHVMDPGDFEKVFRAEGKYPRRPPIDFWVEQRKRRNRFPGVIISEGEEWRRIRQSIAPKIMRPKIVEENIDNFNAVAKDAIARLVKLTETSDDHIPDLEGELSRWSTESIGTLAFDSRLGLFEDPPPQEALKFIEAVQNVLTLTHKLVFSILSRIAQQYGIDTPTFKKYMKSADAMVDIGQGFVDKKMIELKEMSEKGTESSVVPVLTYLLAKEDLSPEEANGHAIDLVAGGVDTTSKTVLWLLYNLARYPRIQEKLYQEVESVVRKGEDITTQHLAKIPYLKACLKESMRLTPVTVATARILDEDIVLSGYHVPAETCVLMDTYCTGRSEKYFKDPLKFKPERWLRENKDENHVFSHLPFGFGTRMCLGRRVAELEMHLFVCKLLQRFRLEYHFEPLELRQKLITVPDRPVKIKFIDRL